MAAGGEYERLNLLAVGKTGDGKSATCNTLIGQRKFKTSGDSQSVTAVCQYESALVQGLSVTVVDSPGLADTDKHTSEELVRLESELLRVLARNPEGFDAILIVIRFGRRLTDEDKTVFSQLNQFFGENFTKEYGILLVTCADNYDPEENDNMPIETFFQTQGGTFKEMREKCNNRVIAFDNKTKDKSIQQNQVKRLLDTMAEMRRGPGRYTPEAFKNAQSLRDKAILLADKTFIDEKIGIELEIISRELQCIPADSHDKVSLATLKGKLQQQRKSLVEQDKGTGALSDTISKVENLENEIDRRIQSINTGDHFDVDTFIKMTELLMTSVNEERNQTTQMTLKLMEQQQRQQQQEQQKDPCLVM